MQKVGFLAEEIFSHLFGQIHHLKTSSRTKMFNSRKVFFRFFSPRLRKAQIKLA